MTTTEQLQAFCAKVDAEIRLPYYAELDRKWIAAHGEPYAKPLRFEAGPKYARLITESGGQASVYCFVRLDDGAILKAASYRAPAKGVRGNIHEGLRGVTPLGAAYRR